MIKGFKILNKILKKANQTKIAYHKSRRGILITDLHDDGKKKELVQIMETGIVLNLDDVTEVEGLIDPKPVTDVVLPKVDMVVNFHVRKDGALMKACYVPDSVVERYSHDTQGVTRGILRNSPVYIETKLGDVCSRPVTNLLGLHSGRIPTYATGINLDVLTVLGSHVHYTELGDKVFDIGNNGNSYSIYRYTCTVFTNVPERIIMHDPVYRTYMDITEVVDKDDLYVSFKKFHDMYIHSDCILLEK